MQQLCVVLQWFHPFVHLARFLFLLQQRNHSRRSRGTVRRQGSRKHVGVGRKNLVVRHIVATDTETSTGSKRIGHRSNCHLDLASWNAVNLRQSSSVWSQSSDRQALVQKESELVLVLDLDQSLEIRRVAKILRQSFGHNESSIWRPFTELFLKTFQDLLQMIQIVVVVPFDVTSGN